MSNTPPTPDRGELRAIPDQGERRTRLVRDGQQDEGGVLVEHSRLIHHDPLATGQVVLLRRAAVGRSRLRVRVAQGEAGPNAIGVPPEPVRVDERGHGVGRHAELAGGSLSGLLRRRHHPHTATILLGGTDRGTEHGGLARTGSALDHDQRPRRGDRLSPRLIPVQPRFPHDRGCTGRAHGGACNEPVTQLRLDRDDVQRRQVRHMLRRGCVGWEDREAAVRRQPRRESNELAQFLRGGAHAGLGDDVRHLLLHVMHRPGRRRSRGPVKCTGGDLLHGQIVQRAHGLHSGAWQVGGVAGVL